MEKKQLSAQQKEANKQKWKKRRPAMLVALLLIAAIAGGALYSGYYGMKGDWQQTLADSKGANGDGASGNEPGDNGGGASSAALNEDEPANKEYGEVEGTYLSATKLAAGLQEKYADKSLYGYTYGEPVDNLGRVESIEIELGYDAASLGVEYWTELFAVYQDPDLTHPLGCNYEWDKETGLVKIMPPNSSICKISISNLDTETAEKYPHTKTALFDDGAASSWGNLGTLYLASYRDTETGKLLEQPEVSIITLEGELEEAPKLTYSILADGRPMFKWNEVEGATEYMVCQTSATKENGYGSFLYVLGITENTSWTTKAPEYSDMATVNKDFKTFRLSQDEWKNESNYDYNMDKYGTPDIPCYDTSEYAAEEGICVIAVNGEGTSMMSNVYQDSEMAPNLPYQTAYNTEKENGFLSSMLNYNSVKSLPIYDYVTMCDGYTVTKLIDYQTEKAYVQDKRLITMDDEGNPVSAETVPCLSIPYIVEGTPFAYEMSVEDYDEANLEADKAFLEDRESKLRKKSGDVAPEYGMRYEAEKEQESQNDEIRTVTDNVWANNALSEYLATNMLGGAGLIDLEDFPEARDTELVDDALMEAYYQNPLILGIQGYRISKKGTAIRITYEDSLSEQARKQQEIQEKVSEVIGEIITDDMSEQQKELAINKYLCDTITYDEDALANAEENDFMYVDSQFNDSFNAYGALLNGKCVCAGYAAAFKLLATEAGLESIVVTGFLDGDLAHAWNKVKIDGEWQIVDVTNNDSEFIYNALLNLPSSVGDRILVEDKEYMLDKAIADYVGESDDNEFYHITDSYFPIKEIAANLAKELEKNGTATLRTEYDLNDNDFYDVADAVYEIMGDDIDLYGYYWLGVIYLTTEE